MSSNDAYLLTTAVRDRLGGKATKADLEAHFPTFVLEEVLKDYGLNTDEFDSALVEGGDDGGIDAFLTLMNGSVVADDTDFSRLKRDVVVELHVFTATTSRGFDLTQIDKLRNTMKRVLKLELDDKAFGCQYNAHLVSARSRFRSAVDALTATNPTLRIMYHYASMGTCVHRNVQTAANELRAETKAAFSFAEVEFSFLTSSRLLELVRRQPSQVTELPFEGNAAYVEDGSYVCLVRIPDYFRIIADESGWPSYRLFEDNVRDFEGKVVVNQAILRTLEDPLPNLDFWWLNNGITVTASSAVLRSGKVVLTDMSVVNGLQTSFQICHYMRSNVPEDEKRRIVVRIISTDDEEARTRIIAATNNQTRIRVESLHATEKIHRDIEEYLKTHGYYYERRRNYYRNRGEQPSRIVGIRYLSQALIALVLHQPDYARARPTTLTEDAAKYRRMYDTRHDLRLYLNCLIVARAVDHFMHDAYFHAEGALREMYLQALVNRTNLRWHVSAYVLGLITSTVKPSAKQIGELSLDTIAPEILREACEQVVTVFGAMSGRDYLWGDALAKSEAFTTAVYEGLGQRLMEQ